MSATKSIQINLRVPDEVVSDLDTLARQERASRADLARQILLDGIAHRKRALAGVSTARARPANRGRQRSPGFRCGK